MSNNADLFKKLIDSNDTTDSNMNSCENQLFRKLREQAIRQNQITSKLQFAFKKKFDVK